ncbi:MAG: hydantoinase/oxoprolinase family protein [Treponema sp.]|nr:hydantoinase/oxoprolinase family protein [Treponema sp.]
MKIGIGIDTGGTYTDAVIYDFEDRKILGTAKALTTKNDLSIGIIGAIDGLPADLTHKAELISLSTTLATNACVEDRGGRAKLIFFGGDKNVIDEFGTKYGLPPSKDIYIQESYTKFSGEIEREPDWVLFTDQLKSGFEDLDGAGIVEIYAMRNAAVVEKKAKEIFQKIHDIPVVCGHELFSELNCLQRGSSTLLNARLFPVIREFISAIKKALSQRNIDSSIVIVRSDGSLMSESFASLRPVETLLCGPAASAISGTRLSDSPNSIIVDMGGTTTDIAIVRDGVPITAIDGVSIGRWKTYVEGLYIKTFGLGGDSAIHYDDQKLYLEQYRVIPLCVAAHKYPVVTENLRKLELRKPSDFLYEHYMLIKDISESDRYTVFEKSFCNALKEKPLINTEAAKAVGKDLYTLDVKRLIKDGVVQICGLTATDIMHIKGDFTGYCSEASLLAVKFAAYNLNTTVQKFCDQVYHEVKRLLYLYVVEAMLENRYSVYLKNGVNKDVQRFINDNYEAASKGTTDKLLSVMFRTEYTLVGIGAPIHLFLDDVAKALGARSLIPKHYEVANALGAIMGSICAVHSVEIKPNSDANGITGYTVFGSGGTKVFMLMADAVEYAVSQATERARAEAVNRGATGNLTVSSNIDRHEAKAKDCAIYMGTTVTARAIGSAGF